MKLTPIRRPHPSEEGYILIAVIFLLALLIISLAIAAPNIKKEIQRDRDIETMHRGKQYMRAIRLYYKKFGGYPPNVDALIKPTNNVRFLRKKYIDPTTGKDEWKPIRYGQNKAPTAMGFFGQPMAGSMMGGIGLNCGINGLNSSGLGSSGLNSSSMSGSSGSSFGSSGSSFGSSGSGFGSSGSSFDSSSSGFGSSTPIGGTGCASDATGASGSSGDTSGPNGSSGSTSGPGGSSTDTSSTAGNTDSTSNAGSTGSTSGTGSVGSSSSSGSSAFGSRLWGGDRTDFWRRGHHRLLPRQPQAVYPGLQEEESL